MTLVGFETGSKAYCLWDPSTWSVVVSANVKFDKNIFPHKPQTTIQPQVRTSPVASSSKVPPSYSDYTSVPWLDDDDNNKPKSQPHVPPPAPVLIKAPSPPPSPPQPIPPVPPLSTVVEPPTLEAPATSQPTTPEPTVRRSTCKGKEPEQNPIILMAETGIEPEGEKLDEAYLQSVELFINENTAGEPTTYSEAIRAADLEMWQKAMNEEIESLESMGTWEITPLPADRKAISCKWVYRIKRDADGNPTRYKARLVARGFTQVYSLDYDETSLGAEGVLPRG